MAASFRFRPRWPTTDADWRRAVLGVGALAVLLRLALVMALGTAPRLWEYDGLARNVLAGKGLTMPHLGIDYFSYYSGVPYVALTALAYALATEGHILMLAFQALLAGLGAGVVALIAGHVLDRRVGVAAGVLASLHPALVYYDVRNLHPLGMDTTLMLLPILLLLMERHSVDAGSAPMTGLVLGLGILQRGSPALFVPPAMAWLALGRSRAGARRSLMLLAGVVLIVLPWLARNVAIHGRPLLTSKTGELLWIGNAPGSSGSNYLPSGEAVISLGPRGLGNPSHGSPELARDEVFLVAFLEHFAAEPASVLLGMGRKFIYFWTFSPQTGVTYPAIYRSIYLLYYAVIVALAALGLWRWRHQPDLVPALTLIASLFLVVSLTHAVLYFEMRHRWALEPLILIFSAAGLIGPGRAPEAPDTEG